MPITITNEMRSLAKDVSAFERAVNEVNAQEAKELARLEKARPKTLGYDGSLVTRKQYEQIIADMRGEADKVMNARANSANEYQANIAKATNLTQGANNLQRGMELMENIFSIAEQRQEQARVNALQDRASAIQRAAQGRKEAQRERVDEAYSNLVKTTVGIPTDMIKANIAALLEGKTSGKDEFGNYLNFADDMGVGVRLYSHEDGNMSLVQSDGGSDGTA